MVNNTFTEQIEFIQFLKELLLKNDLWNTKKWSGKDKTFVSLNVQKMLTLVAISFIGCVFVVPKKMCYYTLSRRNCFTSQWQDSNYI